MIPDVEDAKRSFLNPDYVNATYTVKQCERIIADHLKYLEVQHVDYWLLAYLRKLLDKAKYSGTFRTWHNKFNALVIAKMRLQPLALAESPATATMYSNLRDLLIESPWGFPIPV